MQQETHAGLVALVTGSTSGIGLASARGLATRGATVVLAGRRRDEGEAAAGAIRDEGGQALYIRTDVNDDAQLEALVGRTVEEFGRLDIAFNNAGIEGEVFTPTHEQSLDNYERVFRTNVRSVFNSMRLEIPAMLATGGGTIVNNASVAGLIGFAGMSVYSASKHAVVGLTRAAAVEYAPEGVRINAVAPGGIDTELYDRVAADDEVRTQIKGLHPIGRTGKPEEIASAVLWLTAPDNTFTTGTVLTVDGGFTAQ